MSGGRTSRASMSTFTSTTKPYRLRYHTGAIDQRALTNRPPVELLADIIIMIRENGMYVRQSNSDSTSFKLKVVRPARATPTVKQESIGVTNRPQIADPPHPPTSNGGFIKNISSFPMSFIKQLRARAKYGSSWNKGFDGSSAVAPESSTKEIAELGEIKFYVEIQKIKNLKGLYVVEFKRRQGDIWEFKRLYQELLPLMKLDFSNRV